MEPRVPAKNHLFVILSSSSRASLRSSRNRPFSPVHCFHGSSNDYNRNLFLLLLLCALFFLILFSSLFVFFLFCYLPCCFVLFYLFLVLCFFPVLVLSICSCHSLKSSKIASAKWKNNLFFFEKRICHKKKKRIFLVFFRMSPLFTQVKKREDF